MASQFSRISPWIKGLLVPGSTGEGWEMSDDDVRAVLSVAFDLVDSFSDARCPTRVLVGILKTETSAILRAIEDLGSLLAHPAVAGITICPAKAAGSSQRKIRDGLAEVLKLGLATALYQLPQVTGNEMAPETVAELAAKFDNFVLFKDTSGTDRVALSQVDLGRVFLVRGSEQAGYARWTRSAGGPYDGFLLSTANVFAEQFSTMLAWQRKGRFGEAEVLSSRLSSIVNEAFSVASRLSLGNPFTNTNKLMDHLMAYGERACEVAPPMLYSGERLPIEAVYEMKSVLRRYEHFPEVGYLAAFSARGD